MISKAAGCGLLSMHQLTDIKTLWENTKIIIKNKAQKMRHDFQKTCDNQIFYKSRVQGSTRKQNRQTVQILVAFFLMFPLITKSSV